MEKPKSVNVWLGSEPGILKAVDLVGKVATNYYDQSNIGKEQEIISMCREGSGSSKIYTGHKCGTIRQFDYNTGQFNPPIPIPEFDTSSDELVRIYKHDESFVTCTTKGNFLVWKNQENTSGIIQNSNLGPNIHDVVFNKDKSKFASGGKENALKVFDSESLENPIFKAKNVPHDWLQLRVPIWVTGIRFFENSSKIVTCTGKSQVRLYDTAAEQRRPVIEMKFDEYPLTAVSLTHNENQVIAGNTRGMVGMFDLRKKGLVRSFKGLAGGVRCLECHPTLDYIASCGLDRFLRIHNINTGKLEYKVYLKARLNCLMFSDLDFIADARKAADAEKEAEQTRKRKFDNEILDGEDDTLWRKMKTINDNDDSANSESDDDEQNDESSYSSDDSS
uniref:WD repeat-containing protein 74-like n=1 Tax=Styela clava TaxID=7725 RepID=UPI00193A570E|nr:WD repeat-containing protein 74-like [Styela clava]